MIAVKVQKISFHPPSRSYAVILSEINGKRKLPVIVGSFEAQYELDVVDIGFSVLKSMVGAGQAGTFGGTAYTPAGPGVEATEGVEAVAAQEAGGSGIQGF